MKNATRANSSGVTTHRYRSTPAYSHPSEPSQASSNSPPHAPLPTRGFRGSESIQTSLCFRSHWRHELKPQPCTSDTAATERMARGAPDVRVRELGCVPSSPRLAACAVLTSSGTGELSAPCSREGRNGRRCLRDEVKVSRVSWPPAPLPTSTPPPPPPPPPPAAPASAPETSIGANRFSVVSFSRPRDTGDRRVGE